MKLHDRRKTHDLCRRVSERAAAADRHAGSLAEDVADLRDAGWLRACLPHDAQGAGWGCEPAGTMAAFEALRRLGRANLSLVRLFEGHMNAVKLVAIYADSDLAARTWEAVVHGALLGVWGADVPGRPVALVQDGVTITLSGAKRFASGLGLVEQAVLTAQQGGDTQLLLAPVDVQERSDPSSWVMAGMRATRSGTYIFDGLRLPADNRLGGANDYFCEPHFEGGIWRYSAAHLGAAEALYHELRAALVAQSRAADPHQEVRIVRAAIACETARLWLTRAAGAVEAQDAAPSTATLSLLAREVTEESCRVVLGEAERALGMAAHVDGSNIERIRRDLALFLCQAVPNAKRSRAAQALVAAGVLPEKL